MIKKISSSILIVAILVIYCLTGAYAVRKGLYLAFFYKGYQFFRGLFLIITGIIFESCCVFIVTMFIAYFLEQQESNKKSF